MVYYACLHLLLVGCVQDEKETKLRNEKAIKDALSPKPSGVGIILADTGHSALVILTYGKGDNLGYEKLKIEVGCSFASRETRMWSSFKSGTDEHKIAVFDYDGKGKRSPVLIFEEDKDKLAKIEKRCDEIREVIAKTLGGK